jgi:CheY-like chemotaxis protein
MKRILIVDDEPQMLRVLQFTLERAGYQVVTECDGQAGLEHVLSEAPDALVSDIRMPRMDGREMVQAISRQLPERSFPIMIMSSLTAREEREWVGEISNVEFIEKPVSPRQLMVRLARIFETGTSSGGAQHA